MLIVPTLLGFASLNPTYGLAENSGFLVSHYSIMPLFHHSIIFVLPLPYASLPAPERYHAIAVSSIPAPVLGSLIPELVDIRFPGQTCK
jgi:hypothetical protein